MKKLLALVCLIAMQSCVIRPVPYYPHGGVWISRGTYRSVPNYHRSRGYWSPVPVKPIKPRK